MTTMRGAPSYSSAPNFACSPAEEQMYLLKFFEEKVDEDRLMDLIDNKSSFFFPRILSSITFKLYKMKDLKSMSYKLYHFHDIANNLKTKENPWVLLSHLTCFYCAAIL